MPNEPNRNNRTQAILAWVGMAGALALMWWFLAELRLHHLAAISSRLWTCPTMTTGAMKVSSEGLIPPWGGALTDGDKIAVCNQCKQALIDIDNYGEQLTGCLTCNRWSTAEGKRKKLSEEDLPALYLLKQRSEISGVRPTLKVWPLFCTVLNAVKKIDCEETQGLRRLSGFSILPSRHHRCRQDRRGALGGDSG